MLCNSQEWHRSACKYTYELWSYLQWSKSAENDSLRDEDMEEEAAEGKNSHGSDKQSPKKKRLVGVSALSPHTKVNTTNSVISGRLLYVPNSLQLHVG